MKKLLPVLLLLCACSKTPTTSTGTSGGTTSPTPGTSKRMPMPYWASDTLVCVDIEGGARDPKHRIDCLIISSVGGESKIYYNGKTYVAWIDTTWFAFKPYQIYYPLSTGISETMSGPNLLSKSLLYWPPYLIQSGDTIPTLRTLEFPDTFFNKKALKGTWFGRQPMK